MTHAREVSNEMFLQATAAAFVQTWRLVDAFTDIANDRNGKTKEAGIGAGTKVTRTKIEDVM